MTKRFSFRLARVRRVREIEEQVARAAWSHSESEARAAEGRLAESRVDVRRAREELHPCARDAAGRTSPTRVLLGEQAISILLEVLRRRRERALTARSQADRLQAAWRARKTERRALEELEGRARTRHRVAAERAENAQLDEQASFRSRSRAPGREPPSPSSRAGERAD